ncbi:fimbrial biogenesis outer membrane usher protein [Klebsiella oxytoca]|nr:fimbria/pilus outer membrane usher protein [Klebsiella oxytoca]EKU6745283.1 fimbrial biogenesis outer membrane usher protein [Klebsiella oxytoca]EKU7139117.1 fimbrial biogenesis outer membrane usher protein [Klebsiella oxytoca]EKV0270498.1 fimbrial biogenesis outer membrane usher protein [Klebsiella oxytoca]EKV1585319.1 fimbrial biogenesis outer membrane usher protein [Klebsiella oxytoca]EKV9014627.1 fimbrial biogenesis outer membrane usher protein [Klebsiella oxytoca]
MQSNTTGKKNVLALKSLAYRVRHALPMMLAGSGLICHVAQADDFYFDPSLLETNKSGLQTVDLSAFSQDSAQLPGEYIVDIYINNKKLTQRKIPFVAGDNHQLIPQFTVGQLRELGFKVDEIPALAKLDDAAKVTNLAQTVPNSSSELDLNHGKLNMSVPQIMLYRDARGYVDPSRWDNGIPVLFTNYNFTGSESRYDGGERSRRQYLNMQNGANLGPWRLRNYSTWTHNSDTSQWDSINTWLQRDIKSLKSQLVMGESATDGSVFSSYQFTGARLYSDDSMLPNSQRGFAPTIRGIANSSAIVTVRQNGYTIYQSTVPAGAFEINDLYPSSFSGDLDVTIEEADGTTRHFVQPFSSLPMMQRPGHLKYSVTAGRFRAAGSEDSKEPEFIETTGIYGLSNTFTLYGGLTGSEDYQALTLGIGGTLGEFGALSMDIGRADTRFDNGDSDSGYSWRTQYIKDIPETGTNLSLGYYRYTSTGYFTFSDANQRDIDADDRQSSEIQFSINQNLFTGVSFYASGSQQEYWDKGQKDKNLSIGLSGNLWGVSYNVSGQFTDYADRDSDRSLSISLSVPLDRWLPHANANWRITSQKEQATQHEVGINGSLLEDSRLSYSLKQRQSKNNDSNGSSLYGSYRSAYGTVNAGYDYSSDNHQMSYGLAGGIVAHSHGVTLSQPLGNAFALIDADGASGIRVKNYPGIATDYFGYAVIPYLTSYQENRIYLDTTTMPDDVDVTQTMKLVVPSQGAAVTAQFSAKIGQRVLLTLTDRNGKPLPFGAMASSESQQQQSIVDEGGVLYLTGVNERPQAWNVRWGNEEHQQCRFTFSLPANGQRTASVIRATTTCR